MRLPKATAMTLREDLHHLLLPLLETLLDKCRPLSWPQREEMVGGASVALFKARQSHPGIDPTFELPRIIALLIEDVGAPPVTEGVQAILYSLSNIDAHRDAGEAWLEAHPDEAEELERAPSADGLSG